MSENWQEAGGGGEIRKFVSPGDFVQGRWLGWQKSNQGYRDLGRLQTEESEIIRFPLYNPILSAFDNTWGGLGKVPAGTMFRITFTGEVKSKAGMNYKMFSVQFKAAEGVAAPPAAPQTFSDGSPVPEALPGDDDEIGY